VFLFPSVRDLSMAGSINKVILVGNVGRDPEIRSMQDGTRVANFTLATTDSWRDRNTGEKRERTEWHRVVIFNDALADVVEKYVKKGKRLYVEGALQTRKWTDNSGQERTTTEIVLQKFRGELVLLDGRGEGAGGPGHGAYEPDYGESSGGSYSSPASGSGSAPRGRPPVAGADFDDEIPF
jgi:single-strand DNA-binding protein